MIARADSVDPLVRPRRVLLVEVNIDGTSGGSHQAMFDLARHFDPTRYEPVALFYQNNAFVDRLRSLGIQVLIWEDVWRREHGTPSRWFSPRRAVGLARAISSRVSLLRSERIDLVHMNNSPSYGYLDWLPAARMLGIPCVTHLRGDLYPITGGVMRWLNCRFDRYIAISAHIRGVLESERFPQQRILQIEDGVDIEGLRRSVKRPRAEVRAELGVPEGALLAVMAGHLRNWKGHDVVLRALGGLEPALRSRIHVAFAGADDQFATEFRESLDDLVRTNDLGSSVSFLGARDDVPDLMNAADLVLHASTRPEPFGLVVVEGIALGRLVIAAGLGGPLQILGDGSGWTFNPQKPAELTELLRRVILKPELATAHGAVATARAERFTVQRTTNRIQNVYDELLA